MVLDLIPWKYSVFRSYSMKIQCLDNLLEKRFSDLFQQNTVILDLRSFKYGPGGWNNLICILYVLFYTLLPSHQDHIHLKFLKI